MARASTHKPTAKTEELVWRRDLGRCIYCGGNGIILDHVIPYTDGGPSRSNNLVCCCNSCNHKKARNWRDPIWLEKAIHWLITHDEDVSWMDSMYL